MSEVFSFASGGAETLDDFNARLAQFCADNPVVNIDVSVLGDEIFLSLMEDGDTAFTLTQALQPFVFLMEAGGLETKVSARLEEIRDAIVAEAAQNGAPITPEDVSILKTTLHPFGTDASQGFAVVVLNAYEISAPEGDDQ